MHFEEQGESGLTSRARVLVQNRLRRTAVENRNRERDMVAGFS
jgi:hypothetical protein